MAHKSSKATNDEFMDRPLMTWLSDCLEIISKHKLLDELVVCTPKYSDVLKKQDNQLLAGNVSKCKIDRNDEIEELMRKLQEQSEKFALENAAMMEKMAELGAIDEELEQKIQQLKLSTSSLKNNHIPSNEYPNRLIDDDNCNETLSSTNSSSIEILNFETEMIEHLEQSNANLKAKVTQLEAELATANREKLYLREKDTRESSDNDEMVVKAKASMKDRRSARFQTLKQDYELLKKDFATLTSAYEKAKSLNEEQRVKNERISELETQKRELEDKCKMLLQLKEHAESHNLALVEMVSRTTRQNHELVARALENKKHKHEQQRELEKHRSAKKAFGKRNGSISGSSSTESEDFGYSEGDSDVNSPTTG